MCNTMFGTCPWPCRKRGFLLLEKVKKPPRSQLCGLFHKTAVPKEDGSKCQHLTQTRRQTKNGFACASGQSRTEEREREDVVLRSAYLSPPLHNRIKLIDLGAGDDLDDDPSPLELTDSFSGILKVWQKQKINQKNEKKCCQSIEIDQKNWSVQLKWTSNRLSFSSFRPNRTNNQKPGNEQNTRING